MRFCQAVRSSYTFEVSWTIPMCLRDSMVSPMMSCPKIRAVPLVGRVIPVRMRMVVVFPAPFGPRYPKISPSGTVKETLSRAWIWPYLFERFITSMARPGIAVTIGTTGRKRLRGGKGATQAG